MNISEFARIEEENEQAIISESPRSTRGGNDFFAEDNFTARRSGAGPSNFGNAYDPESLLTGAEIEAGLGYEHPRDFSHGPSYRLAVAGKVAVKDIPTFFPRGRQ